MTLLQQIADESTLRQGFARVHENRGCAGSDGVRIADFAHHLDVEVHRLHQEILAGSYLTLPLLRIAVARSDGGSRELAVPAVRDRTVQSAALSVLEPIIEPELEACSFGYRRGRSVRAAVDAVRLAYADGFRWVLDADIDAFFDRVDRDRLRQRLRRSFEDPGLLSLLDTWIDPWFWDGSQLYRTELGIPQGSVVSPALANLFLDDFDEAIGRAGLRLVRYADDFLILCRDRPGAERAARITDEVLDQLHLTLDEADIRSFDDGFTFLGATFVRSLVVRPWDTQDTTKRQAFVPPYMSPAALHDWRRLAEKPRRS